MAEPQRPQRSGPASAGPLPLEEVAERAARLGITPERVLEEYARIAFSNLRDLAEWGPGENGLEAISCRCTRPHRRTRRVSPCRSGRRTRCPSSTPPLPRRATAAAPTKTAAGTK